MCILKQKKYLQKVYITIRVSIGLSLTALCVPHVGFLFLPLPNVTAIVATLAFRNKIQGFSQSTIHRIQIVWWGAIYFIIFFFKFKIFQRSVEIDLLVNIFVEWTVLIRVLILTGRLCANIIPELLCPRFRRFKITEPFFIICANHLFIWKFYFL